MKIIALLALAALVSSDARAGDRSADRIAGWIALDQAEVGVRFRRQVQSTGTVDAERVEHRVAVRGDVRLDTAGRQRLVFGLFTGEAYASGWNTTGIGGGRLAPAVYLKHLYVELALGRSVDLEAGSFPPTPGQSTTVVGYDNDGYVEGVALRWRRAGPLDTIAVTYAHFDSSDRPQMTDRLDRLVRPNFVQVLLEKRLHSHWTLTGDYVRGADTKTIRMALSARGWRGVDAVRFEMYREAQAPRGWGVGLHARRSMSSRLTIQGGYGDIDTRQALLSATEFFDGRRLYAQAEIRITSAVAARALGTFAFANGRPIAAGRRIEAGLTLDLLALFR